MKLTSSGSDPKRKRAKTSQGDESIPYTVALFSARELYYENLVLTRPGFLAESLYLLAEKIGTKSRVSCRKHRPQLKIVFAATCIEDCEGVLFKAQWYVEHWQLKFVLASFPGQF